MNRPQAQPPATDDTQLLINVNQIIDNYRAEAFLWRARAEAAEDELNALIRHIENAAGPTTTTDICVQLAHIARNRLTHKLDHIGNPK